MLCSRTGVLNNSKWSCKQSYTSSHGEGGRESEKKNYITIAFRTDMYQLQRNTVIRFDNEAWNISNDVHAESLCIFCYIIIAYVITIKGRLYSSVSIVTRLRSGRPRKRGSIPGRNKTPRQAPGSTSVLFNVYRKVFPLG